MPPAVCPQCGADVPPDAKACPECGSDEKTGWSEAARAEGLGLPDAEFDYGDFIKREFGGGRPVPRGIKGFWWLIALLVLALFVWLLLK